MGLNDRKIRGKQNIYPTLEKMHQKLDFDFFLKVQKKEQKKVLKKEGEKKK